MRIEHPPSPTRANPSKVIENPDQAYDVIIEANRDFLGGREEVLSRIIALHKKALQSLLRESKQIVTGRGLRPRRHDETHPYIFGNLGGLVTQRLVDLDREESSRVPRPPHQRVNPKEAIYRIWENSVPAEIIAFAK